MNMCSCRRGTQKKNVSQFIQGERRWGGGVKSKQKEKVGGSEGQDKVAAFSRRSVPSPAPPERTVGNGGSLMLSL